MSLSTARFNPLDFGHWNYQPPLIPVVNGEPPGLAWGTDVKAHEHIVRFGINYRLDWASPLVAKY
jgi:hypothetical protein